MATRTEDQKSDTKRWVPRKDCPRILLDPAPPVPDPSPTDDSDRVTRAMRHHLTHADAILDAAVQYFRPVRVYACFSGGYDSVAPVAQVMSRTSRSADSVRYFEPASQPGHHFPSFDWRHRVPVEVLHINTGIGIEKTRQYVRDLCRERDWPLAEIKTPMSYEDMVLGRVNGYPGGFPGPAMHKVMYNRLKERAIYIAVRRAKANCPRNARVMFLSGIRHDESQVRSGYARAISKVDSQVWVNPWYWADHEVFTRYRQENAIPSNEVKEKLGMSGECLCGAYAERGELERIGWVCPATKAYILDLERRARDAGFDWGWEDPGPPAGRKPKGDATSEGIYTPDEADDYRPLCHNCDKVHLLRISDPGIGGPHVAPETQA